MEMEARQFWEVVVPLSAAMLLIVGMVPACFAAMYLGRRRMPLWSWFAMFAAESVVLAVYRRTLGGGLSTLMELLSAR
jgi:hypothetical protein